MIFGAQTCLAGKVIRTAFILKNGIVTSSGPPFVSFELIGIRENGQIVFFLTHIFSVEVQKRSFRFVRPTNPNIVGSHKRIVGYEEKILFQLGIVNDFRSFNVVFFTIKSACN